MENTGWAGDMARTLAHGRWRSLCASSLLRSPGHMRVVVLLAVMMMFICLTRMLPSTLFSPLDGQRDIGNSPQPVESAASNFPGSAFFFAQDALTPAPEVRVAGSAHIMPLEKVVAAPHMAFVGRTALDRYRALTCLTNAIYYEAANEPDDGQRAVAQVVLNRVRHPSWPNSICGVIYQGTERTDMHCQFTFSCDGSMARPPVADKWARARRVAQRALAGDVFAPVGMATHYHTLAVRPPWSSSLDPVAVVGAHIFYRMRGMNGTASAFRDPYSAHEDIAGPSVNAYVRRSVLPDLYQFAPPANDGGLPTAALAPANPGWTPPPPAQPRSDDNLPESAVRPEYRNSGRPLF